MKRKLNDALASKDLGEPNLLTVAVIGGGFTATSFVCQLIESTSSFQTAGDFARKSAEPPQFSMGLDGMTCNPNYSAEVLPIVKPPKRIEKIILFEKTEAQRGGGLAWSPPTTANPIHLFNIPLGVVCAKKSFCYNYGGIPCFSEWLQLKHSEVLPIDGNAFPARVILGEYLKEIQNGLVTMSSDVRELAPGLPGFTVVAEEVFEIQKRFRTTEERRSSLYYEITSTPSKDGRSSSTTTQADIVVLALGIPPVPRISRDLFGPRKRAIHPWPTCNLEVIREHASVAILGTGLTAIDSARQLLIGQNHKGPIIMTSRRGAVPPIWMPAQPGVFPAVSLPQSEELMASARRAVECVVSDFLNTAAGEKLTIAHLANTVSAKLNNFCDMWEVPHVNLLVPHTDILSSLERQIEWHETILDHWTQQQQGKLEQLEQVASPPKSLKPPVDKVVQAFGIAFEDELLEIWRQLSPEEKVAWIKHPLRAAIQTLANGIPIETARMLLEALQSGASDVFSGSIKVHGLCIRNGLRNVEILPDSSHQVDSEDTGKFRLDFKDDSFAAVDFIIDATGFDFQLENTEDSVLQNMVQSGLIQPDSDLGGIGLKIENADTLRVSSRGNVSSRIFVAGHLGIASELLTSGLSFCERMAGKVVRGILEEELGWEDGK